MQLSILFITFILQFHSALASPTDRWQLVGEVGATGFPGQNNENGYECGNDFFSDSKVEEALTMYLQRMNQDHHSSLAYHSHQGYPNFQQNHNGPQRLIIPPENNIPQNIQQYFTPELYKSPLYSDSESSNYILWPIQNDKIFHSSTKYSNNPYYIVIKKNDGKVIDVISKTINNNYTKCIRIDGPRTELSTSSPEMYNGYQCAHEFLGNDLIQASLHLLRDKSGITNKYPMSYIGRLYPVDSGYKIWPILSRGGLYDDNSVGPYFLVIDGQGKFIEAVVQGLSNNFLRCTRSRGFSETPPSNVPNHSPKRVPKVHHGYYCGMYFFYKDAVMQAAKKVKTTKRKGALTKYNGPPFNQEVLLWPLLHNGNFYETGGPGLFRVVLTKDFQFKCVAIMRNRKLRRCKQGIMKEKKDHEKSDYSCADHIVSNHDLIEAAQEACNLSSRKDKFYPATYVGPVFDKSGPYFTYPIYKGQKFRGMLTRDRVVINPNCEVVGAITFIPNKDSTHEGKKLVLCMKSNKVSTAKTYIEPDVPISEQRGGYMRPDEI